MKWVRIKLDQVNEDDPSPLIITAPIDEQKKIALSIPHAGWWGIPSGNKWCRPIVFKPDGTVDFGGDPENSDEERYAGMQIFGRSFELGERFYMEDYESKTVSQFVVREISEL